MILKIVFLVACNVWSTLIFSKSTGSFSRICIYLGNESREPRRFSDTYEESLPARPGERRRRYLDALEVAGTVENFEEILIHFEKILVLLKKKKVWYGLCTLHTQAMQKCIMCIMCTWVQKVHNEHSAHMNVFWSVHVCTMHIEVIRSCTLCTMRTEVRRVHSVHLLCIIDWNRCTHVWGCILMFERRAVCTKVHSVLNVYILYMMACFCVYRWTLNIVNR